MDQEEMGTFEDLKIRLDALEALLGIYGEINGGVPSNGEGRPLATT